MKRLNLIAHWECIQPIVYRLHKRFMKWMKKFELDDGAKSFTASEPKGSRHMLSDDGLLKGQGGRENVKKSTNV